MPRRVEFIMEVGLTGPDWEPKDDTKHYAQLLERGKPSSTIIGFGATEEQAIGQCFDAAMRKRRQ